MKDEKTYNNLRLRHSTHQKKVVQWCERRAKYVGSPTDKQKVLKTIHLQIQRIP